MRARYPNHWTNEDLYDFNFYLKYSVEEDLNDLDYMDSICYLSKKHYMMEANNINGNYLINMHLNKNKIEISK